MLIIFESVLMLFTKKLSKLFHACQIYSLPKLARYFETHCITTFPQYCLNNNQMYIIVRKIYGLLHDPHIPILHPIRVKQVIALVTKKCIFQQHLYIHIQMCLGTFFAPLSFQLPVTQSVNTFQQQTPLTTASYQPKWYLLSTIMSKCHTTWKHYSKLAIN